MFRINFIMGLHFSLYNNDLGPNAEGGKAIGQAFKFNASLTTIK